jgi:hypothetical protein
MMLPAALDLGVDSSTKNEYQKMSLEGKTWPASKAYNLKAICEPIV